MRSDNNNTQSAAECIRIVCRYHNVKIGNIPMAYDTQGIIDILKQFDLFATDLHMGMRELAECPKPVIVQTVTGYMTVLDANTISVKITYGENETHRIAFLDFIKVWTGLVIVIEPPPKRRWRIFR